MKSFKYIATSSKALPLLADDVTELHASRLLLLLKVCGTAGRIEGLTKLAKMDFFVRYPAFFDRISERMGEPVQNKSNIVESNMVRHHYGPWDKRYYQVLPFLESRSLINVAKDGSTYYLVIGIGYTVGREKRRDECLAGMDSVNILFHALA